MFILFFIIRDIPPKNGSEVFFSHEIYEKYSLAPSLSELWNLSNRYIYIFFFVHSLVFIVTLLNLYVVIVFCEHPGYGVIC